MTTTCPQCGAQGSGSFCSSCGTPLTRTRCPSCGADTPGGARFCTRCGASLAGEPGGGGERIPWSRLGWGAAGILLLVVILLVAFPVLNPGGGGGPGQPEAGPMAPAGGSGPGGVDLSTLSPREAADRLFNRVMAASEGGNQAEVQQFLPMALSAYGMVEPMDADAHFHVSLLQRAGGNYEAALAAAREGLELAEGHLLNLAAAGNAAALAGDSATARDYYRRFMDTYDAEVDLDRPGYDLHASLLPQLREEARRFLAGTSGEGGA